MNEIDLIIAEIHKIFANDCSGHDVWHSLRVYSIAMKIAGTEQCDKRIVAIAALLHDVDDRKLFENDNYQNARRIMSLAEVEEYAVQRVIQIIEQISFKGIDSEIPDTIEGKIVQDADRLDAIGAIGIARAFAYGGAKARKMYDPNILPALHLDREEYFGNRGTVVNHFYEKLFLLKDMMNTAYAKEIAEKRGLLMHKYIEEFLAELEGDINA